MAAHSQLMKTKLNCPIDKLLFFLKFPTAKTQREGRAPSPSLCLLGSQKKPRNCITGYNSQLNLSSQAYSFFLPVPYNHFYLCFLYLRL
ncbi:MAG: hypothetical protein [Inoviridae sp.]|nr:MAG: hypothetical protein [Inoviridae sp.]